MASRSSGKMMSGSVSSSSFTYKRQKVLISILFLAVPLILLLVFTYLPAINMFFYSFTKWDGFGTVDKFVGLQNYVDIFTKPRIFFGVCGQPLLFCRFNRANSAWRCILPPSSALTFASRIYLKAYCFFQA